MTISRTFTSIVLGLIGCSCIAACSSGPKDNIEIHAEGRANESKLVHVKFTGAELGWWFMHIDVMNHHRYILEVCADGLSAAESYTRKNAAARLTGASLGRVNTTGVIPDSGCTPGRVAVEAW